MIDPSTEEWRPVVGLEGLYEVSNRGRVRSLDRLLTFLRKSAHSDHISTVTKRLTGRVRKLQADKPGDYPFVMIESEKWYAHRMVLDAFVGPCPNGMECLHADDNRNNSNLGNLEWGTRSKNVKDAYARGRMQPYSGPERAMKAWETKRLRAAERADQS